MPLYMLDTNICIYISRQKPEAVLKRFDTLSPGDAVISIITYGELCFGAEKSTARDRAYAALTNFVSVVPVASMSPDVGEVYGRIRADLTHRGELISANDLWIAAHSLQLGVTLVTNNEREFTRVTGLKVENWV